MLCSSEVRVRTALAPGAAALLRRLASRLASQAFQLRVIPSVALVSAVAGLVVIVVAAAQRELPVRPLPGQCTGMRRQGVFSAGPPAVEKSTLWAALMGIKWEPCVKIVRRFHILLRGCLAASHCAKTPLPLHLPFCTTILVGFDSRGWGAAAHQEVLVVHLAVIVRPQLVSTRGLVTRCL